MPVMSKNPDSKSTARRNRQDGTETRQRLLDVAGQVFAERGYADATSKEICERAGANSAAVNYHFGSREQLYAEVLVLAHNRLMSPELLQAVASSTAAPPEKLRLLISRLIGDAMRDDKGNWELRVIARELLSPSAQMAAMLGAVLPKIMVIRALIAELLGLPLDHPAVLPSTLSVIAPCLHLLIVSVNNARRIFPQLVADPEVLVEHLLTFSLAGLKAARERATG